MPDNMERFTVRARRVLSQAAEEAHRMQHGYIGAEHLLLGLMREEGGVAARVLRDLAVDDSRVEKLAEQMTGAGPQAPGTRLELTPGVKEVLHLAVDEARRLGHHYVGTEHILSGLVRQKEGVAIDILKRLNVSPEQVRRETQRILQQLGRITLPRAGRTGIYPPLAGQILALAHQEAEGRGHHYVGIYHLLLALMRHDSVASLVLSDLGLAEQQVEEALQNESAARASGPMKRNLMPAVRKAMEAAIAEADSRKSRFVSSTHVLYSLLEQNRNVFEQLKLDPEVVRARIEQVFRKQTPASIVSPEFDNNDRPASLATFDRRLVMDEKDIYRAILEAQEKGQAAALATVIRGQGSLPRHVGSKMLVWPDGRIVGSVGGGGMEAKVIQEAQAVITDGRARIVAYTLSDPQDGDPGVCGGSVEIFIEPLALLPTLVVIGCGHVGKALAELGKWLGYRVIVSDDRPEFCTPQHIPNMDGYAVCPPSEIARHVSLGPQTYVACVTRGMTIDIDLFPPLLQASVPYLGLIGSRRRWSLTVKALEERGFTAEQLARVHSPIGLELQAETPHEIALSIMAEIIMLRRGGTGQPMQWMGRQAESAT